MINRIASSGLDGSNHILRSLQDNISNLRSVAFRGERTFTLENGQTVRGASLAPVNRSTEQGALDVTGEALDLALAGKGYFVLDADGERVFTRAGDFQLDDEGGLRSAEGHALLGYPGTEPGAADGATPTPLRLPLPLPQSMALKIDPQGRLWLERPGEQVFIGSLALARFPAEDQLQPRSRAVYAATEASGDPVYSGADGNLVAVRQGQLEQSNVAIVDQLTALIGVQNAFSAQARSLSAYDEMLKATLADMR